MLCCTIFECDVNANAITSNGGDLDLVQIPVVSEVFNLYENDMAEILMQLSLLQKRTV